MTTQQFNALKYKRCPNCGKNLKKTTPIWRMHDPVFICPGGDFRTRSSVIDAVMARILVGVEKAV